LDNKAPDAFRTISEVADDLDLPQHVLRFWESRFHEIKPMKRGGGRRYYRPDDIDLLRGIRHLLYGEGYTIRGVQRILREQGTKFVQVVWLDGAPQPPHGRIEDDEEQIAEEVVTADDVEPDEDRGLRGRISSLIGRDLGDRHDDAATRVEPPMTSAPVPRVDPADRAIHSVTSSEPAMAETTSAQTAPSVAGNGLAHEDLHKLHAALHDLVECRKLIDAVVVRPH
jgi:DNA-binding transcriptional MerR regulator